jgi:ribosomal-protein-alanine N-acetyltransferase
MVAAHRHGNASRVLRDGTVLARVRAWPYSPDVAQLVVYRSAAAPTETDVRGWLGAMNPPVSTVRTGALGEAAAAVFRASGFHEVQRLALLEHRSPSAAGAASTGGTRRMRGSELDAVAVVDRAAFAAPWSLDAAAIDDACSATARHRARVVRQRGEVIAYAISGRDGTDGYLQRLAVTPQHQGQGAATALVLDALHWCGGQHAHRVLVNTHVENTRALQLYRRLGFVDLPDQLVVLERAVP